MIRWFPVRWMDRERMVIRRGKGGRARVGDEYALENPLGNDGSREVLEVGALGFGGGPLLGMTTKEGLDLSTTDQALGARAEREAGNLDHRLAIGVDLDLAVLLANVIELDTLGDLGPLAGGPLVRAAADRGAVDVVRDRLGYDLGEGLGIGIDLGKVRVELSLAVLAPHETSGPAVRVMTSTAAGGSDLVVGTTVEAGHLSAEVEVKALFKVGRVAERNFGSLGKIGLALGVQGETADGAGVTGGDGASLEQGTERGRSLRGVHVLVWRVLAGVDVEGGIVQRSGVGNEARSGPGRESVVDRDGEEGKQIGVGVLRATSGRRLHGTAGLCGLDRCRSGHYNGR